MSFVTKKYVKVFATAEAPHGFTEGKIYYGEEVGVYFNAYDDNGIWSFMMRPGSYYSLAFYNTKEELEYDMLIDKIRKEISL